MGIKSIFMRALSFMAGGFVYILSLLGGTLIFWYGIVLLLKGVADGIIYAWIGCGVFVISIFNIKYYIEEKKQFNEYVEKMKEKGVVFYTEESLEELEKRLPMRYRRKGKLW